MATLESAQLEAIKIENIKLRQQIADLRFNGTQPGQTQADLMHFLDSVADVVARHPFVQTAPNYFAAALHTARQRMG